MDNQMRNLSTEEITEFLKAKDLELMKSWYNGNNSGSYKIEGEVPTRDIIYLCAFGICEYNKLSVRDISSKEFLEYIIDNLEMFLEHGNIPSEMQEYYIDVLNRGHVQFLNEFLETYSKDDGTSRSNSRGAYVKATAAGRAFAERDDNAFASVLLLPAILALVYILAVVVYFVFIK